MQKGTSIHLCRGVVELTTNRGRTTVKNRLKFSDAIVVGDDLAQLRKNFRYSQCFLKRGQAETRKDMEEAEAQGRVRLLEIHSQKVLGTTNY